MTKRFRVEKQTFDGYCIVDNHFDGYYAYEKQDLEKLCENLNDLNDENDELRTKNNAYLQDIEVYREKNTHLKLENEQLKQRNTNQYNQLTELWEIIEEENWEKLIAMKKQLKEDEERLQKEWVCYE